MDLTETFLKREELVRGVLLHAYRDSVRLPDGETSVREWIDHPGAAAIVPVFADGTTLMVRQFRYAPGREFLEVPAGKCDIPGASLLDVARQELEEEVGYTAEKLTALGSTYPCIGYSNEVIHLFLAEDLSPVENRGGDADEFLEPVRLPLRDAVEMARNGEILDSKSAVALMRAAHHLNL